MKTRDIIVIGASAGGIQSVCGLLKNLPSDLPASTFLVQHIGSTSEGLVEVLARCGPLKTIQAVNEDKIERSRVYVAAPDRHLLLNDGHIRLTKSPRENRHRPSVDALFRSAARTYRSRVIAVILSGALDDGAIGAMAVKARGGLVVVQDPKEAQVADMPEAVLRAVSADYCVPLAKLAPLLVKLTGEAAPETDGIDGQAPLIEEDGVSAKEEEAGAAPFTCPECDGPLYQLQQGGLSQYRCLVGHSFSPETLTEAHREALERALLTSLRKLRERSRIHQCLAGPSQRDEKMRLRHAEAADAAAHDTTLLQEILERI